MAFADWVFEQTANATANLTATTPLFGSTSLELTMDSAVSNQGQAGYVMDSAVPLGITRGKVRTLINKVVSGFASNLYIGGVFCLAEDTDFGSNASTSAYMAHFDEATDAISLRYTTLDAPSAGELFDQVDVGFVSGTTFGLELEWNLDFENIGGTHFIVRTGTMTDFSDLTEQINYVDSTVRTINGYEGIFMCQDFATTPGVWYFDQTSIFTIS